MDCLYLSGILAQATFLLTFAQFSVFLGEECTRGVHVWPAVELFLSSEDIEGLGYALVLAWGLSS